MVLLDYRLDRTLVCRREALRLKLGSAAARGKAPVIHGSLERVAFPAKDVVAVLSEAGSVIFISCQPVLMPGFHLNGNGFFFFPLGVDLLITTAQHQRLRPIGRPVLLAVKLASIPDDLIFGSERYWAKPHNFEMHTSRWTCGILTG